MIIYMFNTIKLFERLKIDVNFNETEFLATKNEEFEYIKLTPINHEKEGRL